MPRKADPRRLLSSARALDTGDLEWLIEQLKTEASDRTRLREDDHWNEEYRKCGKAACWCADVERGHGPYYYRSVRVGTRVKKEYRSRKDPA